MSALEQEPSLDPPRRRSARPAGAVTGRVWAGLRSGWRFVIAVSVLCAAIVFLVSVESPVRYEASARVFLDGAKLSANGANAEREVQTQSNLAVSGPAMALVSRQLRLPPDVIAENVITEAAPTGNYFTITGTSGTADGAVRLVTGIEQAYKTVVDQQVTDGDAMLDELANRRIKVQAAYDTAIRDLAANPNDARLQARVAVLAEQVKALSGAEGSAFAAASPGAQSLVQLAESPPTPPSPSAPRPVRDALLGAVFGLLLATVLLWW